ncbi:DNA-directed RNA polymerase specialized sigma24 family protein [Streptomyces pseudovenezuelae]|uniref:DNA-directed RNA polymerase specialized sigma24 family protein n=1 Tax=Streptomyces pseudovenezuelae TaxID=67350 RepID=A0ABT6LZK2_9ACTN|nr:DNA-directed RNA polymerase specialized sigma24 family protein [Streptomyces pseudovenezuelae]
MENIQTATDRERAARFTALYVRDHPRVSAFLRRRIGDRGAAEELTAGTFLGPVIGLGAATEMSEARTARREVRAGPGRERG